MTAQAGSIGVVVIGRNEGDRLRRCLESLVGRVATIVYVDSGSTDGSQSLASGLGADVVTLPPNQPFTAARARNAGFDRLLALRPDTEFVQFVDGDCRVQPGWIERAVAEFDARPKVAVVCGRRRETNPDASVYNRLCDLEWDTPVGDARSCGGDAMMRAAVFREVGGYNPEVIAGEEPELCVRIRRGGWTVARIDAEMTEHDAAMTRFSQWWRRTLRAGHSYAEGMARHGAPPERRGVREVRSIVIWGVLLPALALAAAWPSRGLSILALVALDLLQAARIAQGQRRRGRSTGDAWLYAGFTMLGKIPQAFGAAEYWLNRARGRRTAIIEYKGPADTAAPEVRPAANAR